MKFSGRQILGLSLFVLSVLPIAIFQNCGQEEFTRAQRKKGFLFKIQTDTQTGRVTSTYVVDPKGKAYSVDGSSPNRPILNGCSISYALNKKQKAVVSEGEYESCSNQLGEATMTTTKTSCEIGASSKGVVSTTLKEKTATYKDLCVRSAAIQTAVLRVDTPQEVVINQNKSVFFRTTLVLKNGVVVDKDGKPVDTDTASTQAAQDPVSCYLGYAVAPARQVTPVGESISLNTSTSCTAAVAAVLQGLTEFSECANHPGRTLNLGWVLRTSITISNALATITCPGTARPPDPTPRPTPTQPPDQCGSTGQACCGLPAGSTSPYGTCDPGKVCSNGTCENCGNLNDRPCYENGVAKCNGTLFVENGRCITRLSCGNSGQACCGLPAGSTSPYGSCNPGKVCSNGTCENCGNLNDRPCYENGVAKCNGTLFVENGRCITRLSCGNNGQACCGLPAGSTSPYGSCNPGKVCSNGTCEYCGGSGNRPCNTGSGPYCNDGFVLVSGRCQSNGNPTPTPTARPTATPTPTPTTPTCSGLGGSCSTDPRHGTCCAGFECRNAKCQYPSNCSGPGSSSVVAPCCPGLTKNPKTLRCE